MLFIMQLKLLTSDAKVFVYTQYQIFSFRSVYIVTNGKHKQKKAFKTIALNCYCSDNKIGDTKILSENGKDSKNFVNFFSC